MEKAVSARGEDEDVSLKELILGIGRWYRYILYKWLIIIGVAALCAVLGIVLALFMKPYYIAKTTFVLESGENGGGLGQYAGIASMVGLDVGGNGGGIFQGDNIIELYKSRRMIEKTLLSEVDVDGEKKLLIDLFIEFNGLRKSWSKDEKLRNIQFDHINKNSLLDVRLQDSILGAFVNQINKEYLDVSKPDKKLSLIEVDVKSNDEFFAKCFNDEIVANVNDFFVQTKTKKSMDNIAIIQNKVDSVRLIMNGAISTSAQVADATLNLNPSRQVQRIAPMQRSQFTAETSKAMLSELVKSLEMAKIGLLKETPLIQVVDHPILPLEKKGFGKTKGVIYGGLLGGFLTTLVLTFRYVLKRILA
jgi:hypothetical protein